MENIKPVDPKMRIDILDILRGFALLGIIFNNIQYFSGYTFIPFSTLKLFTHYNLNEWIYHFLDIIVTAKFYTLFSILFAVGFYLQYSKYREEASAFLKTYRRRLFILLLIGIVHSLVWFGDILFLYAVVGFILILFRNVKSKNLLKFSVFFFILPFLLNFLFMLFYKGPGPAGEEIIQSIAHSNFPGKAPDSIVNTFVNGNIFDLFSQNIFLLKWKWMGYIPSGRLFVTLGIFLLGYYLGSIQFFKKRPVSLSLVAGSFLIGFFFTLAAYGRGGDIHMFPSNPSNELFRLLILVGHIFMCFFYILLIFRINQHKFGKTILHYLKPVGRMALTNYFMQTLICKLLFCNFGFDLICRTEFLYAVIMVITILVFQIIFSNLWLSYYRFGPLEWAWRSLTYKKMVRIR